MESKARFFFVAHVKIYQDRGLYQAVQRPRGTCRSEEIVFERTPDVGEIGRLDFCNGGGDFVKRCSCFFFWQPWLFKMWY